MAKVSKTIVNTNDEQELLALMDGVIADVAKGEQVTCNLTLEIPLHDLKDTKSFLDAWSGVFEIIGARFKCRKVGFWRSSRYKIRIENSDPITAKHFVAAYILAAEEEDK